MSEKTVFELAGKEHRDFVDARDHTDHLRRLRAHMQEISDDPSGTELKDYLGEEDRDTVEQFLTMAEDLGWPDAESIALRGMRGRSLGLYAWTSNMHVGKSGTFKNLFLPEIGDTQRGYVFARLNITPTQPVAIGEDRKLYSKRGPELIKSKGVGWGALPKPEYLRRAIEPVSVLLNYDSRKHLANSLVSRIKPGNLPPGETPSAS